MYFGGILRHCRPQPLVPAATTFVALKFLFLLVCCCRCFRGGCHLGLGQLVGAGTSSLLPVLVQRHRPAEEGGGREEVTEVAAKLTAVATVANWRGQS